jgi:hypothetical protein
MDSHWCRCRKSTYALSSRFILNFLSFAVRIVYYIDPGGIYDVIPIEASAVLYDLAILVWIDVGYMLVFYWYAASQFLFV